MSSQSRGMKKSARNAAISVNETFGVSVLLGL